MAPSIPSSHAEAHARCLEWIGSYDTIDTTADILIQAAGFAAAHAFGIWDAVILHAAGSATCALLLSEDMHHGFTWGGVTVVNSFAQPMHPRMADLLASA